MKKRAREEIESELREAEKQCKRLRKEWKNHIDTLREKLPDLIGRLLADTGRLTFFKVKWRRCIEFGKHQLMCRIILDKTMSNFYVIQSTIKGDEKWGASNFWIPDDKDKFKAPRGEGWNFLLKKNNGDERKALASLVLISLDSTENGYTWYTANINHEAFKE